MQGWRRILIKSSPSGLVLLKPVRKGLVVDLTGAVWDKSNDATKTIVYP